MAPNSNSVARMQSTLITENLDTVREIYSRFEEAVNEQYLPTLEAADEKQALSISDNSDLFIYDPEANADIAPIFLAYLAPYAPGLTISFVAASTGQLPTGETWSISDNGPLLVKSTNGEDKESYSTAALRHSNPTINGLDFREFWPEFESSTDPKGFAVYRRFEASASGLDPEGEADNA